MKTIQRLQPNQNEDALYEEALLSLKELNQEVVLNDLNQDLNDFIQDISEELSLLQSQLTEDIQLTASVVAAVKDEIHEAMESFTEETKENLAIQDGQVSKYFSEFTIYFNTKLDETLHATQAANETFIQHVTDLFATYDGRLKHFSEHHNALYEGFQSERKKLEKIVGSFQNQSTEDLALLKEIRQNWLDSIDGFQQIFLEKTNDIQAMNEAHQAFIKESNDEVISKINQLNVVHEQMENIVNQHEQRQQVVQQEMESLIDQLKIFIEESNEKQHVKLQGIIDELKDENVQLSKTIAEQHTTIQSNQKMNISFFSVLSVLLVVLIVLQFI